MNKHIILRLLVKFRWTDINLGRWTEYFIIKKFDDSGSAMSAKVIVSNDWDTHVPDVSELSNGNVVVAWQNYTNGYRQTEYKVFDNADNLITGQQPHRTLMTILILRLLTLKMAIFLSAMT